jgi:hypothetical protein
VRLLVRESWYSIAEPIYGWCSKLSVISEVVDFDDIDLPELPEMPIELDGLGVTVFLLRLVLSTVVWAVKHGIELSKFELHRGWAGPAELGWTPVGSVLYREC